MKSDKEHPSVEQNFHGPVRNVAGRDIIQNLTSTNLLTALQTTVEHSPSIPEADKASIIGHLKSLLANPYVIAIASGGIVEAIKAMLPGRS